MSYKADQPRVINYLFFNKAIMNTFSIKRTAIMFFILASAAIITVAFLSPKQQTKADEARLILENNDILSLSETIGTKNLTNLGNVKFLFDEKNGFIAFGQGWGNETDGGESIGGTQLWILDTKTNRKQQLVKEFDVTGAVLGNGETVYYTTRAQDLFVADSKGSTKKIQEKVLQPSISNDGKTMVYQKLPPIWKTGNYYDEALGLTLLNLNTLTETRLTKAWEDWGSFFSPDGKKILFVSANEYGIASFFEINTDGTNKIQLTNKGHKSITDATIPTPSERPIFSQDGKYLTFESDRTIWAVEFNPIFDQIIQAKRIAYGVDPKFSKDNKSITVVALPTQNSKRAIMEVNIPNALSK